MQPIISTGKSFLQFLQLESILITKVKFKIGISRHQSATRINFHLKSQSQVGIKIKLWFHKVKLKVNIVGISSSNVVAEPTVLAAAGTPLIILLFLKVLKSENKINFKVGTNRQLGFKQTYKTKTISICWQQSATRNKFDFSKSISIRQLIIVNIKSTTKSKAQAGN